MRIPIEKTIFTSIPERYRSKSVLSNENLPRSIGCSPQSSPTNKPSIKTLSFRNKTPGLHSKLAAKAYHIVIPSPPDLRKRRLRTRSPIESNLLIINNFRQIERPGRPKSTLAAYGPRNCRSAFSSPHSTMQDMPLKYFSINHNYKHFGRR